MMLQLIKKIDGICLWWDEQSLVRAVGRRIDISHDNGLTFTCVATLDIGFGKNSLVASKLASRLLRLNPKHCIKLNDSRFILVAAGFVFALDVEKKRAEIVSEISGNRPLRMAYDGKYLYYGEYLQNPDRQPINLYRSVDEGCSWELCYTFTGIRHIHGVYFDAFTQDLWITTGDFGEEAAIWRADTEFRTVSPVLSGSQQTRAIDLLFDGDRVLFGTDAPEDDNYLYSMHRDGSELKILGSVPGPVFHAFNSGRCQLFSTACEPSNSLVLTHSSLMVVSGDSVEELCTLKKDVWSMKYFQYGQILFPAGTGITGQFWCSSFACEHDQTSFHFTYN